MLKLSTKNKYIRDLLDEQKINIDSKYRSFKYISIVPTEDGIILLNNLTDEYVFLDKNEKGAFLSPNDFSNSTSDYLIKNYFLVPEDFDDLSFSKSVEDTVSLIYRSYKKRPIESFTILTTTDCNARCFYCYQHGCEYKTMSQKTAEDVADYILKHKADKELVLRWFGGEPLYNSSAIDIITDKLIQNKVPFKSIMTSNGYLFDEETVSRAKNKWNLVRVQITLDGTENIYNRVKSYIYKDSISPYKIVTDNIERLLKKEIIVNLRMNMDEHNVDDLFKLTDELLKRYKQYDKFYAYSHLLYEDSFAGMKNRSAEKSEFLRSECDRLLNYIRSNGKDRKKPSEEIFFLNLINHCMADSDNSIMVLPDGKLGKCEHYLDDRFVGSIYDDKIDLETINWFKNYDTICDDCDDCELRSRCRALKRCPSTKNYCSSYDRERIKKETYSRMLDLYNLKKDKV